MPTPRRDLAICLEQTLGHRTHGLNLEDALTGREADARVFRVEYERKSRGVPWAVRGSRQALRQLRRSGEQYRVSFFHTQTIGLWARAAVRGDRYVISVDATPLQVDELGRWYRHRRHAGLLERGKLAWYRHVLRHADSVVAWSNWAKQSLVDEYGVARERVLVAHPGAPDSLFAIDRMSPRPERLPKILFVGGDLQRKGGDTLLDAFAPLAQEAELTLMTEADVPERPGVRVLHGVRPGDPAFTQAFAEADIFCLPTLGDCTPVALGEAMAAGLPVITTKVGSNHETVGGDAGLLVKPGDVEELQAALRSLVEQPGYRLAMGTAARRRAEQALSARRNANLVIDHLLDLAK